MHPEIEKLINMALVDGEVSEKERTIILRKAESLGIDKDEVEMILDAKIHQNNNGQSKPIKEKIGNIQTCPACGGSVKAMEVVCADCGHEFQNKNVNKSIRSLIEKLEKEDNKNYEWDNDRSDKKAKIISQFPIPQTKEDILEFLSYSFPFLENTSLDRDEKKAWKIKVGQALMKAKIASVNNSSYKELINEYEVKMDGISKDEKKAERNEGILIFFLMPFMLFIVYLIYAFIATWFDSKYWPFN